MRLRLDILRILAAPLPLLALACEAGEGGGTSFGTYGSGEPSDGGGGASSDPPVDDDADTGATATSDPNDSGGDDVKFDTPGGADDAGDGTNGCKKVDFLFVIDDSGSMAAEQDNLAASFPGFIAAIQQHLDEVDDDYHVMVVDSDANPYQGCVDTCAAADMASCQQYPDFCVCFDETNEVTCSEVWGSPYGSACDNTLGAGVVHPRGSGASMQDCGVEGGARFIGKGQPDLEGTFACMAKVGTSGDGDERPMSAMMAAVGPTLGAQGQCNEGFVRDDAILVVTIVSDAGVESSSEAVTGDAASWKDALVAAKNGNVDAITVLAVMPDDDVPGGVCDQPPGWGANPKLRELVDSFGDKGIRGSICAADYTAFFVEAVASVIATTCDEFDPRG